MGHSLYTGHVRTGKGGTEIDQILNQCSQAFTTQGRLTGDYIWMGPQGSRTSHQIAKISLAQASITLPV